MRDKNSVIDCLNHVPPRNASLHRRFLIWTCKMWTPIRNRLCLSTKWGTHDEPISDTPTIDHQGGAGWWWKCKNCGGLSTGNVKPLLIPARSSWTSTGLYACLECEFTTFDAQEMLAHSQHAHTKGAKAATEWPEVIS